MLPGPGQRARRRAGTIAFGLTGLALGTCASTEAAAAEVRVGARTIGEGYVILAPGPDGEGGQARLLRRTRLVQYVNLGAYELLPPKQVDQWRREEDDGQLEIVASLRLRQDFGEYLGGAGPQSGPVLESIDGRQIDLLYGYVQGRRIGGFFDFRAGRQFEASGLDWYVFDGGWARARTPAHLAVEVFGGLQANPAHVFGYPSFALDGTSGLEPADRAGSPMVGAGLSVVDLDWVSARVAYRRTFTPAGPNRSLLEPTGAPDGSAQPLASGVDQEIVSATVAMSLAKGVVSPFLAARYNIGTVRLDDVSAGLSLAVSDRHTVRAQYLRTVPSFDLDSVFNLFTLQPIEDVRVSYQVRASEEWTLLGRGSARIFRDQPSSTTTAEDIEPQRRLSLGWTGNLTALWRRQRYALRTDAFAMGGEGGVRAGGSVDGQIRVLHDRIGLDLRTYFTRYEDDQQPARAGYGLAFQAGADIKLWDGVHLTLLAEELLTPYIRHAFRALGNLAFDWSFRAGRPAR